MQWARNFYSRLRVIYNGSVSFVISRKRLWVGRINIVCAFNVSRAQWRGHRVSLRIRFKPHCRGENNRTIGIEAGPTKSSKTRSHSSGSSRDFEQEGCRGSEKGRARRPARCHRWRSEFKASWCRDDEGRREDTRAVGRPEGGADEGTRYGDERATRQCLSGVLRGPGRAPWIHNLPRRLYGRVHNDPNMFSV